MNGEWFTSSVDSTKISATIQGLLAALSGFIIYFAAVRGHVLTPNDITSFGQQITAEVSAVFTVVSGGYALFGIIRKVFVATFGTKSTTPPKVIVASTTNTI
jgi:hypothetical protein